MPPPSSVSRLSIISLFVCCLAGCGGPGYTTANLAGRVTVDGAPVAKGTIMFTPLEGNRGPGAPVEITAGSYSAVGIPRGKLRVDFNATRETGKMIEVYGKPSPEVVNVIPPQYWTGVEIEVTGDNGQQDFLLKTKP